MSQIKIDMDLVESLNGNLYQTLYKLSSIRSRFSSLVYSVDSAIAARRGIGSRLNSVNHTLGDLEIRLGALKSFVDSSIGRYHMAENHLKHRAILINDEDKVEDGNNWTLLPKGAIDLSSTLLDSKKLLIAAKGLAFRMYKQNGEVYIKIVNGEVVNQRDFQRYRSLLTENLGGTSKWKYDLVENMTNDGVPLYNANANARRYYRSTSNKFSTTQFDELNDYVKSLNNPKIRNMGEASWKTFKSELNVIDDFKGWSDASKMTKFGKAFGILGTAMTIGENFKENFYKGDEFEYTGEKTKKFVVDTAVDVGSAASLAAAGAAVGSFFLPPLGTVVGAVAGVTFNALANYKFGNPPESIIDKTEGLANKAVDAVGDFIDDVAGRIGKTLNAIFW